MSIEARKAPVNLSDAVATAGTPSSIESVYSPDGVDLTLIRWMLSLTPAQRLEVLQRHVRAVLRLRHGSTEL